VLGANRVLLGALQSTALQLPPDTPVDRAMQPAPGTIRPDLRIDEVIRQLDDDHLDQVFVTTARGELVGLAVRGLLHV
jgi:CBS domain-containing protein